MYQKIYLIDTSNEIHIFLLPIHMEDRTEAQLQNRSIWSGIQLLAQKSLQSPTGGLLSKSFSIKDVV